MKVHHFENVPLVVRPKRDDGQWGLSLPCGKLGRLFDWAFPNIQHIGWRSGRHGETYTYFRELSESHIASIEQFAREVKSFVFMDDVTDGAFALDMHHIVPPYGGLERSEIGLSVYTAKYEKFDVQERERARDALSNRIAAAVKDTAIFSGLHMVCAVPASKTEGGNILPVFLADAVANVLDLPFHPLAVLKTRSTAGIKNSVVESKRAALDGSFAVDRTLIENRNVLLVDDIYQSGTTVGYITELFREAGAKRVFALAASNTIRDTDNLSGRLAEPDGPDYATACNDEDIPF